jgi:hypothetical protein
VVRVVRLAHWVFKHTLPDALWARWCVWRWEREQTFVGSNGKVYSKPVPQREEVAVLTTSGALTTNEARQLKERWSQTQRRGQCRTHGPGCEGARRMTAEEAVDPADACRFVWANVIEEFHDDLMRHVTVPSNVMGNGYTPKLRRLRRQP